VERYLFLYLKTGAGHLAPARALAERIQKRRNARVSILLADGLSEAPGLVRSTIEDGYRTAVNGAVWTYEFLYFINKLRFISRITANIGSFFMRPVIERYILENKPDKIVIFHFFLIKPVRDFLTENGLDIPVITVVTDPFTAHPIWFLDKNQNFIVFSELLKDKCIERGIEEERLKVFPFVLDSRFSKKINEVKKRQTRKQLGFKQDSRIILILGGGEGIPKGKKILKNIIKENLDAEVAIVCGRNDKLFRNASKLKEKYGTENLKIYRFIDFVHSLISISDLVVTKCGASTSMEILLMGKIPVINDYIWEQEKGNMEFVCNSKMGIMEKNITRLPQVINSFLKDNSLYRSFQLNIQNAGISNGVEKVSDYILNFQ
jgi:UDP-N-acetylglucosamine:LPS N-acetylglucosamine transferase